MRRWIARLLLVFTAAVSVGGCGSNTETIGSDASGTAGSKIKVIEVDLTEESYGIGVDKNQPELLEQVNDFIREIQENGEFDEICSHYMGDGEPVLVTPKKRDKEKDQLIVGSTLDFEPFEYGEIDAYYGIDMEMVSRFADWLGKDLVIVNSNFETMFFSVKQHKCDLCIGGISIDDTRRQYMDFSIPYYHTAQRVVVPADNTEFDQVDTAEEVEEILRAKDSSQTVGVENLTTAQYYCEGNDADGYTGFPLTVKRYRDTLTAMDAMIDGSIDYVVGDAVQIHYLLDDAE